MTADFNPGRDEVENTAAMKREGDLGRHLRAQIAIGRARRETPATAPPPPKPPGYRPGAWPSGTQPPGPVRREHPPSAWAEALGEYREWLTTTDHPELDDPTAHRQQCGCPACTPRSDT